MVDILSLNVSITIIIDTTSRTIEHVSQSVTLYRRITLIDYYFSRPISQLKIGYTEGGDVHCSEATARLSAVHWFSSLRFTLHDYLRDHSNAFSPFADNTPIQFTRSGGFGRKAVTDFCEYVLKKIVFAWDTEPIMHLKGFIKISC